MYTMSMYSVKDGSLKVTYSKHKNIQENENQSQILQIQNNKQKKSKDIIGSYFMLSCS